MRLVSAILAASLLASSALFADDAEDALPVVPIVPVETAPIDPVTPTVAAVTVNSVSAELLDVLLSTAPDPATLSALVTKLTPGQVAAVVARLADDPAKFSVALSALNPDKLAKVKVELFLADVAAWQKVAGFLDAQTAPPKPGRRRFGANWLDAARNRLRQRIDREGYSPAALVEAEALMRRAQQ